MLEEHPTRRNEQDVHADPRHGWRPEDTPPGWDQNPSLWSQRLPIVWAALVGFGIAFYMGLFQLGVIHEVWEPFFGAGTRRVLESKVSKAFPVSDAMLGAAGYLADAVAGAIGGVRRWRTMPWIVVAFGLFIGPFGIVSIGLVMAQPLLVGHWCTLCLTTAVISILMIGPAMDEMLASLQYLRRVQRAEGTRAMGQAFLGRHRGQR